MTPYVPNLSVPPSEWPASWQPIETAPKDGRQLLLWIPSFGSLGTMVTAYWFLDEGKPRPKPSWRNTGSMTRLTPQKWSPYKATLGQPTHWMPLPAGPVSQ